jgi:uncharacterized protein
MLTVDLSRLDRQGQLRLEADLPPDFPLWEGSEIQLNGPLAVRLVAARAGRGDLLVRGHLSGEVVVNCRRCLEPVLQRVDDEVSFLFRSGIDRLTAEEEEVYALPEGAREVDLTDAVREHLILSLPRFVVCREGCRGLCPRCGVNLNEGTCTCEEDDTDERWAPFRGLKLD